MASGQNSSHPTSGVHPSGLAQDIRSLALITHYLFVSCYSTYSHTSVSS
jgi:hypothetical protein